MSAADPQAATRPIGPGGWAAAAAIAALGAWLRLREVAELHLILDERLVLRSVKTTSLLDAFTRQTLADRSPAVTLYAQLLHRQDLLDELTLRLPMLASGLLLLALPLGFRRRLGGPTALLYLALLAVSAPLVYFSFVARPYAPALLAIGVAFAAWDRWCRRDDRASAAVFGVASGVATFLQVFAAPVVAAFFASGLALVLRGRRSWRSWGRGVAWAGVTAALLVAPGARSLLSVHGGKVGMGELSAETLPAVFERLAGGLAGAPWLLALALVVGLAHWLRRDPRLGLAGCGALALPMLALLALRPLGGAADWSRYALLAWPVALLFAASGLGALAAGVSDALDRRGVQVAAGLWAGGALLRALSDLGGDPSTAGSASAPLAWLFSWGVGAVLAAGALDRLAGRRAGSAGLAGLVLLGTLALSPLRLYRQAPDSFRSHPEALAPARPAEAPDFYARLAGAPDAGAALIECPDPGNLIHRAPYARYQRVHRKRVVLLSPLPDDYRRGFRNLLDVSQPERMRRTGARYALVHRNLAAELYGGAATPLARLDAHADACRAALRARFGAPVHADAVLEAFDLHAPTAAATAGAGPRPR